MLVSYGTDFGKHSSRSSQRSLLLGLKILCLSKSIHSMYKVPLREKECISLIEEDVRRKKRKMAFKYGKPFNYNI